MPYMGSKRKLATRILAAMPQRDTLVDLFCGGCAVAHAAMDGNKFKNIIINDINPMCPELFINALSGKYNEEKRWISSEDFHRLKHTDPYVAVVWSFGNNLRNYMYSREIEPLKRAMHYAIYFDDIQPLTELLPGIELCALNKIKEERSRYLFVKHRTKDYLRTHHIAANSALQHFTTANIVSGEEIMGGGTNSIPNGRCSNTSTGDFSYFVRMQHRERHAQIFQLQQSEWGGQIKAFSMDYRKVDIPSNSVIYCDIPYENTASYGTEKQHFSHAEFYEWCADQREPLFISSYSLPYENFVCIAEFPHRSTLSATANNKVVERLFVPLHQKERGLKQLKLFE